MVYRLKEYLTLSDVVSGIWLRHPIRLPSSGACPGDIPERQLPPYAELNNDLRESVLANPPFGAIVRLVAE